MYQLLTYVLPVAALAFGIKFGRKFSVVAIGICALAVVGLSVALRLAVAESNQPGWAYFGEGGLADVQLAFGMGFVLAMLALAGPSIFSRWQYALGCSAILLIAFQVTSIPTMFSLCIIFAACV